MCAGVLAGLLIVNPADQQPRLVTPKLVVVISVDQMRPDYLSRFGPLLTQAFGRFMQEGTLFTEAYHDHGITSTAPGHATISSGVVPRRSGIVSNDWWDREARRTVYAVEDSAASIVGSRHSPGRSPTNLLRSTVGDWLKRQSPDSKVFSVALKDRASILMGGQHPDGAYWFDDENGGFVTSTHYRDDLPDWVVAFNKDRPADWYFDKAWTRVLAEVMYSPSREDSFPEESDGIDVTFPHVFRTGSDEPDEIFYDELRRTPFGDELMLSFLKQMIVKERIGEDATVDLLWVGAGSGDYIGHRYGPFSQELQDYYVRLDGMLENLLEFLDERVGPGQYSIVLTSDHGVMPMPEELTRRGVDARRIDAMHTQDLIITPLARSLRDLEINATPSLKLLYGLVMAFPEGTVSDETQLELRRLVAERLRESELVADAYAYDDAESDSGDAFRQLHRRSFRPERSSDVIIRYKKYYLQRSEPGGTNHESPYDYDRHVPLIFFGPGIVGAWHDRKVRTVDIAPTVAALLGITPPDDLDGTALAEVVP